MKFAIDKYKNRIEVNKSRERAFCKDCGEIVIGCKGNVRQAYWKHESRLDCDSWHEPITQWHLNWQNYFPIKNQEVTMIDPISNIKHRADIKLNNDMVIEIQNSPIKIDEIEQRESFYGKNNMIWILNGVTLLQKSYINYKINKMEFSLNFELPSNVEKFPKYNLDNVIEKLYDSSVFKYITNPVTVHDFKVENGTHYTIKYKEKQDFYKLEYILSDEINRIIISLYGPHGFDIIKNEIRYLTISNEKNSFTKIRLTKKYWRSFIDKIKFPIFIDNLTGLQPEHLFWLQEKKIVEKELFKKKYLKFT